MQKAKRTGQQKQRFSFLFFLQELNVLEKMKRNQIRSNH